MIISVLASFPPYFLLVLCLQIVSIDGQQLRDLEHSHVVKMFQTRDRVSLRILPARFKRVSVVDTLAKPPINSFPCIIHHYTFIGVFNTYNNFQETVRLEPRASTGAHERPKPAKERVTPVPSKYTLVT